MEGGRLQKGKAREGEKLSGRIISEEGKTLFPFIQSWEEYPA